MVKTKHVYTSRMEMRTHRKARGRHAPSGAGGEKKWLKKWETRRRRQDKRKSELKRKRREESIRNNKEGNQTRNGGVGFLQKKLGWEQRKPKLEGFFARTRGFEVCPRKSSARVLPDKQWAALKIPDHAESGVHTTTRAPIGKGKKKTTTEGILNQVRLGYPENLGLTRGFRKLRKAMQLIRGQTIEKMVQVWKGLGHLPGGH